jgi:hypothetical protein
MRTRLCRLAACLALCALKADLEKYARLAKALAAKD